MGGPFASVGSATGRGIYAAAFVAAIVIVLAAAAGAARAQGAPVGDSQTTVRGYVQPTIQGNQNAPATAPGANPVVGDQGPPVEGAVQTAPPGYVDTPTAVQESVRGRPRPEFDPLGIPLNDLANGIGRLVAGRDGALPAKTDAFVGSFVVNSKMELQASHDDNLYRTRTNKTADDLVAFRPSITLGSDWANDELKFEAGGEIGRYRRTGSEDYQDYSLAVSGKLDVLEQEALTAALRFSHSHTKRGSPDDPGSPSPTLFNTTTLDLGHRFDGGAMFSRMSFQAAYYDYLHNGGVENDDRDRSEFSLTERLGIEYVPGTQLWIEPGVNTRRYTRGSFNGNLDRSSSGGQVLGGMTWDYSGITYFEFGAGYMMQTYDDPQFSTIQGPAANGKMTWNATELLTLTATLSRRINETASVGQAGYLATAYGFTADWEVLYNLIADVGFSRENDSFRGGAKREDTLSSVSTGLRYLFGQHWYIEARAVYEERTSNIPSSGFTDQRLLFTLGEQF